MNDTIYCGMEALFAATIAALIFCGLWITRRLTQIESASQQNYAWLCISYRRACAAFFVVGFVAVLQLIFWGAH